MSEISSICPVNYKGAKFAINKRQTSKEETSYIPNLICTAIQIVISYIMSYCLFAKKNSPSRVNETT